MRELYIQKNKEVAQRTNAFCEFLVNLATAMAGGGGNSDNEVGLDTGDGMDEMTDDQIEMWKSILGDDFAKQYPDYA